VYRRSTEATYDVVAADSLVRAAAGVGTAPKNASAIARHVLDRASGDDVAILVARFDFAKSEQPLPHITFDPHDPDAACQARAILLSALTERNGAAQVSGAVRLPGPYASLSDWCRDGGERQPPFAEGRASGRNARTATAIASAHSGNDMARPCGGTSVRIRAGWRPCNQPPKASLARRHMRSKAAPRLVGISAGLGGCPSMTVIAKPTMSRSSVLSGLLAISGEKGSV
jgi:hypothetical protein